MQALATHKNTLWNGTISKKGVHALVAAFLLAAGTIAGECCGLVCFQHRADFLVALSDDFACFLINWSCLNVNASLLISVLLHHKFLVAEMLIFV